MKRLLILLFVVALIPGALLDLCGVSGKKVKAAGFK